MFIDFCFFFNLVFSVIKLLVSLIWFLLTYLEDSDIESEFYIGKINSIHIFKCLCAIIIQNTTGVGWWAKDPVPLSKAHNLGWDNYALERTHNLSTTFDPASNKPYDIWPSCLSSGRGLQLPHLCNEENRLDKCFQNLSGYELIWIIVKSIDAQNLKILGSIQESIFSVGTFLSDSFHQASVRREKFPQYLSWVLVAGLII